MKKLILLLSYLSIFFFAKAQDGYVQIIKPDQIQTNNTISTNLAVSIMGNVVVDHYNWDMYGDGSIIKITNTGNISFVFSRTGTFNLNIAVVTSSGAIYSSVIVINVLNGIGSQMEIPYSNLSFSGLKSLKSKDGIRTNYAIIINGASDACPWDPKNWPRDGIYDAANESDSIIYQELKKAGYTDDNIYYLNGRYIKRNKLADTTAHIATLQAVFADLASKIDPDDYLFVWIEDHGSGYCLPTVFDKNHMEGDIFGSGHINCRVNLSKKDTAEKDIKYCPFLPKSPILPQHSINKNSYRTTNTDFNDNLRFSGLNKWFLRKKEFYDSTSKTLKVIIYRAEYVSHFSFKRYDGSIISDNDQFIELVSDYLTIDNDRDGIIRKTQYDSLINGKYNNKVPFTYIQNAKIGTYLIDITDSTQWQRAYTVLEDNIYNISDGGNEIIPQIQIYGDPDVYKSVFIFDKGNNSLSIAFVPNGTTPNSAQLVAVGTDNDNDGMIDGIDFNQNGLLTDSMGFDESIALAWEPLYSNDLAQMLNKLPCKIMTVGIMSCFSGGFIKPLSANGRVILTGSQKYYFGDTGDFDSYANAFQNSNGTDINKDGYVSFAELYNAAFYSDGFHYHMYDDNGSGKGLHQMFTGTVNNNGNIEGCLGSKLTLNGMFGSQTLQNQSITLNTTVIAPTVTVSNVTVKGSSILTIKATYTNLSSFTVNLGATLIIDPNINDECQ
jgi:hypothetical protein